MNYNQRKFIKKVKKSYHSYWYLQWYQCKKLVKNGSILVDGSLIYYDENY